MAKSKYKARGRTQYTSAEREKYHEKRVNNPNVSEDKRCYSRNWLDGFHDEHAKNNYDAVCSELKRKRGHSSREYLINLNGYKNGLKANLERKK